jgi:teichuronic acid biosynthesis glycosyltransferase TuaG
MNLVSIIIPYNNKRLFIKSTLDSVLKQSYSNFEALIIYDQKDLADYKYINNIIKSDTRFRIYNNNKNYGVSYSRNKALSLAKGKYICFLDSDDIWHKDKIKKQIRFMKKKKILMSHTSYKIIDKFNKTKGLMKIKKNINYNDLILSCDIGLSTVMVHRSLLKDIFFPNILTKEDYVVWLKLSKKCKIFGLQQFLTLWRKLNDSSSSHLLQKLLDGFRVYYKFENKSFLLSIMYLARLSINSVIKKIRQKNL